MGEAAAELDEVRIAPQPGPQDAFARSPADVAFFGGAAGSGKSFALLYEAAKWTHVPGYRAILFRRTGPELLGSGGLWDESQTLYRAFGGVPRSGNMMDWRFDSGARIEFRHLQREADAFTHQGRQYAMIGFDEVTHFTAKQFWYLLSRLRSRCGVRPYIRGTCNPDPDSFVAGLISWWLDENGYPIEERAGVLRWFVRLGDELAWFDSEGEARAQHPKSTPKSFTFIPAKITDNPALLDADPDYVGNLEALGRVDRARLLEGNWKIRASAGMVFRRGEFVLADAPPSKVLATVRFWDKAASEPTAKHPDPDWTRGVRVSLCEGGLLWIDDVVSVQARGVAVLRLMRETAEADGITVTVGVWQDTGGAGKTDADVTADALSGFVVEALASFGADTSGVAAASSDPSKRRASSRAKRTFAAAWAPWVEKGRVHVLRAEWSDELLAECDSFPDARHDDIVDALSGAFQLLVGQGLAWWDLFT